MALERWDGSSPSGSFNGAGDPLAPVDFEPLERWIARPILILWLIVVVGAPIVGLIARLA